MKKLLVLTLLLFALGLSSFSTGLHAFAEENCDSIGPETVIRWDLGELKVGQIGRLTVLKETQVYKLNGNTRVMTKTLKPGEQYRIYAFRPGMLNVGGGFYIDRDARVIYETPSPVKMFQLSCKQQALQGASTSIRINETESAVKAKLGSPKRSTTNEYKLNWLTYHDNYDNYYMVSYINNKVAGFFTMDSHYFFKNFHVGSGLKEVQNALGKPISGIRKGNINYSLSNNKEMQTFLKDGQYITVFFDTHNQGKVTGIQVISQQMEARKTKNFGQPTVVLQQAFEMQMFDLINAARVRDGLPPLNWDERARTVSRKHSLDMAVNHYFDHNNLKGQTPFDRMQAAGIKYLAAGENIAMGYSSSIFAHEAFMNSLGHRQNILNPVYTYVGVGVQFQAGSNSPYYTQDYFLP